MIAYRKFVVLDVETTGVIMKLNDIVQLAGIFKLPGEITNPMHNCEFNFTCRPIHPENIDEKALQVIGKTKEEIMEYSNPTLIRGEFQDKCFKIVNRYNKNDKMFIVGYNVQFDSDMLRSWFFDTGAMYFGSLFSPYVVDLLPMVKALFASGKLEGIDNLQLKTVFKYFFPNFEFEAHDAMEDVNATIKIYQYLKEHFNFPLPDLG